MSLLDSQWELAQNYVGMACVVLNFKAAMCKYPMMLDLHVLYIYIVSLGSLGIKMMGCVVELDLRTMGCRYEVYLF